MGVAAVGLLYATVKRWFGPIGRADRRRAAGRDAGRGADVPVQQPGRADDAARSSSPPTASTRAIDDGKLRWLLVAGAAMGFVFLAKGLQPFTVLPALAVVYLVARRHHARPAHAAGARSPARRWSSAPAGGCSPST